MTPNAERHYHQLLAGVIEDVLRCSSGPIRVPKLALAAGLSRFHLVRLFSRMTGETLEQFLRRMRLERAAYMLLKSHLSILEISVDSGYQSPEAFSRAFRRAYGLIPTEYRKSRVTWKLPSPVGLHWNADWVLDDGPTKNWAEAPVLVTASHACVWRFVGNYGWLEQGWLRFVERFSEFTPTDSTFITMYLDNMWTHPVRDTMRADLGWLCSADAEVPKGMRKILLPAGCFVSTRFIERKERNDAWSYISGRYGGPGNLRVQNLSYDLYDRLPVPFNAAKTKIFVGRWETSHMGDLSRKNPIVS